MENLKLFGFRVACPDDIHDIPQEKYSIHNSQTTKQRKM